jgi:predicted DCC family thiol-disulfide oxidoreductase YuxK
MKLQNPIVLFDGECNLCNSSVQFIIKRDKKAIFKFASLQSPMGSQYLNKFHLSENVLSTFILVDNTNYWIKSSAALKVITHLKGFWSLMKIFYIVPPLIRNAIYDYISKNRYIWFGRNNQCWVQTPELSHRFL